MKKVIGIYAAGGIQKGSTDTGKIMWGSEEFAAIEKELSPIEVVWLNPDERGDDVADTFSVFGRDHYQVSVCDFVVADLRQKRGIGVGVEMLSAKYFKKPVISIAPLNDHYRKPKLNYLGGEVEDYVHAHLFGISDIIVNDFTEAGKWIKNYLESPSTIKDISIVTNAISEYKEKQLSKDNPMLEALKKLNI